MVTPMTTPAHEKSVDAAAEAVASPFPFAPRGEKGYDPASVDDFLRQARAAFETPSEPVAPAARADAGSAAGDAADAPSTDAAIDAAAVTTAVRGRRR